jgi:ParB family chromosome partitioning protein
VQRRLGRGLDFLISGAPGVAAEEELQQLGLAEIQPNPFQPRRDFPETELAELAASIAEHGILQPVIVRATAEGYELVAGERRFRACQQLGRPAIPAVVRTATDEQMLELALVENIQRQDLNPIDTAVAYRAMISRLGITQEDAARRLGKSRSALANMLRLLDLPEDLRAQVSDGTLSSGHARALLSLADADAQRAVAERIVSEGLSVRATEAAVKKATAPAKETAAPTIDPGLAPYFHDLEDQLRSALGTRVSIHPRGDKGRVVIDYFSREEFEGLLDRLLGTEES